MGWNDHIHDNDFTFVCKCPECGKEFKVLEIEQIPGFRCKEDLNCPYCNHLIKTSMEYEFIAKKEEE